MRAALRRIPRPLAALFVAALLLSVGWSLAVPPLQGFDEHNHVAYVARLAESGEPPEVTTGDRPLPTVEEAAMGPLGMRRLMQNTSARQPWHASEERLIDAIEGGQDDGAGPNPLAKNPPLYYAIQAIPWTLTPGGGFFDRIWAMRLWSTVLLLIAVAGAWLAAGEIFARRRLAQTATAGVVAVHPVAGYLSGVVNTDAQLMAVSALLLWWALRTYRLGPSPGRMALLLGLAAAGLLTHGRGLGLVPVALVAGALALWRHRALPRRGLAVAAGAGGVVAVAALAVYKLWTSAAGGGSLYGGEVNLGNTAAFSVRELLSFVWQFYLPRLGSLEPRIGPDYGFRQVFVETGFGSFGSYEVVFSPEVYDLVQVSLVGGALALALVAARHYPTALAHLGPLAIVAALVAGVLGLLHVASYRALVNGGNDPLITGRYLLPLLPVLGLGVACLAVAAPRALRTPFVAATLMALLALSLGGLGLTAARFYA